MKAAKKVLIFAALLPAVCAHAADITGEPPAIVLVTNGGQARVPLSNTNANLFNVAGDRITAINSLDGQLTRHQSTASGGVVVSTLNKEPFTFILETERGLSFSLHAAPDAGIGKSIQLVSDLIGTGSAPRLWEESLPYESLLVEINRSIRKGEIPETYQQIPVTNERVVTPAGLTANAEAVWVGHHLKVVRYSVVNQMARAHQIKESDFWQRGTRAVMFADSARQIIAGGRMLVWVTSSGVSQP